MASTPRFKIYTDGKEYVAAFKHLEDAAAFCAILGDGTTIREDHKTILWTEGKEAFSAGDSYDQAAKIMSQRRAQAHIAAAKKRDESYARYQAEQKARNEKTVYLDRN
jgi:hypothetical protein